MNGRSAFFAFSLVLLVPLVYNSFSTNEACAAPREEGWGGRSCTLSSDEKYKSCCWHEADGDQVCQTCEVDGTNCDPPIVEKESKDILPDAVLEEPSRDSGPKLFQKDGMVFNLPGENNTVPSEQNNNTNTIAKDLRVPGKIEIPNLK